MVYEDRRTILLNELFYNSHGFSFPAHKNREYIIRLITQGRDKLVIMNLENYLKEGHTDYQLISNHLNPHENKTSRIKEELRVSSGVIAELLGRSGKDCRYQPADREPRAKAHLELHLVAVAGNYSSDGGQLWAGARHQAAAG